jgi:hypothetical protein
MIARSVGAHSALAITRHAAAPIHWTMVSIAAVRAEQLAPASRHSSAMIVVYVVERTQAI